jgi:phosphatidate cytidylyltransferase
MTDPNKNLAVRVTTALVLFPIAVWMTWQGGLAFAVLCGAASAVAAAELVLMFRPRLGAPETFGLLVAGLLPIVPWVGWRASGQVVPAWLPAALAAALIVLHAIHLFRDRPLEEVPASIAAMVFAWLYCGLLVSSVVGLRLRFGFGWVILAFVVTWGNDTLAYFAGRAFGRHKLCPRVSPKKTWEGFAAGAVGSVLGALAVKWVLLPELTPWACLAIGAGGAVLGPLGDLSESMLKRAAGLKDSGRIIPGHGGLLDRIDALLFVSPWIYVYAAWLMPG